MINDKTITVVLPAYNAARTLEKTFNEIPFDIVDHVILVDDLSKDDTVEVGEKLGIEHIVRHDENLGYGGNQKSCYNKALELNPKYAEAYTLRGYAWRDKDNYDMAISDFNKAIELNPKFAYAYLGRGSVWQKVGQSDRACKNYKKACELGQCEILEIAKNNNMCK